MIAAMAEVGGGRPKVSGAIEYNTPLGTTSQFCDFAAVQGIKMRGKFWQ